MALNSLLVALQGFAPGFTLSPVTLAVQGLIELLQEEKRNQVYGSGKRSRGIQTQAASTLRDELTEELVRQQWDLLEARLRAQAEDRQARQKRPAARQEAVATPAPTATPVAQALQAVPAEAELAEAAMRQANDEAEALVLMLLA